MSLLSDMISAGLTPNLNTYRVVIVACQEAGQVQLAFEVFNLLQSSKIEILQEVSSLCMLSLPSTGLRTLLQISYFTCPTGINSVVQKDRRGTA